MILIFIATHPRRDTSGRPARRKLWIPHQFVEARPPIMARQFQVTFMALIGDPNRQHYWDLGAELLTTSGPMATLSARGWRL